MEMDASGTNTERPTPGATYLSSPNWLVRTVRGLIPPGPGSRWKLKDADVLMAIDDSKIAIVRLGLAISALFIIYLDPTEPAERVPLTYLALILYTTNSAVVCGMASRQRTLRWSVFVALVAVDIALCTALISLSGGTNSVFFFLYYFAITVAAMRGGSAFGLGATVVSAILFAVFGYIGTPGTVELNRFLLRPICLLVLGYVISLWAGAEIQLKRKLTLLKQLSLTSNPRLNADRIVADCMERLIVFYNAAASVLVTASPDGEAYRLQRISWHNSRKVSDSVDIPAESECPLLHLSRFTAGVYSEGNGFKTRLDEPSQRGKSREEARQCCSQTAEWLDARSFITAPMHSRNKILGQICLTSDRRGAFNLEDALFLQQIVDQIVVVLENVRLVDRLATEAAAHERSRIALSIHDRVIQPYLGLQMGLDAVRQSLRSELLENPHQISSVNGLRSVELLERLSTMTRDGVEELRDYVSGLRRSHGRQARLIDSIRRFASQFADVTGIEVRIIDRITHVIIHDRLAAEVFQMVTEALSNVRRHAHANWVVIYLEGAENTLTIRCENDDSREASQGHFRPASIADRAEALGGRTDVSSKDGYTTVLVEVPL